MPSTKPPSGMRDYLPEAVSRRRYVVATIEDVFQRPRLCAARNAGD